MKTGVAQGRILSPTLFSIFINDVMDLNTFPNHNINSLLFADDLEAFYVDTNTRRLIIGMQRYLDALEIWLSKWRLEMIDD